MAGDVTTTHIPVLLQEIRQRVLFKPDSVIVDGTIGQGGHALDFGLRLNKDGWLIGFDLDGEVLQKAKSLLSGQVGAKITLFEENIRDVGMIWKRHIQKKINVFFLDLGWGSHHLRCGRGFSFQTDEPLILSYATDPSKQTITAAEIVNSRSRDELTNLLREYGEEPRAFEYARAIVEARKRNPIITARDLAGVIERATPRYRIPPHPATKTFQALRIAVNDEIEVLKQVLGDVSEILAENGRVCIISFHSIEDRVVKWTFKQWEKEGVGTVETKKPVRPSYKEKKKNPRSRSARLRIFNVGGR